MGAIDIIETTLESRTVRSAIGERVFKASFEDKGADPNDPLAVLWNLTRLGANWLLSEGAKAIGFSLSALWGLFTSSLQFIWNFDWNMSDQTIDQQIAASWNALAGMLGGTLGNLVGYLGCGVLPGATIMAFNEPMGAFILANVTEELAEEFLANLSNLVRYTLISAVQSLLLVGFKNLRKMIKSQADLVGRIFGDKAENAIRSWGAPNAKPWSFAIAVDNAVESIPNEFLRNFVEEFLEEAWDGCVEAGYVVANSIEAYIAAEKLKQEKLPIFGGTKYVEITPDRSIDDQKIVLAGSSEILKPVIVQTLTTYQTFEKKDIGQFVGQPIDEYLRAKPRDITLVIQWYSVPTPPWSKRLGQSRLVSATATISSVNRAKLEWDKIKLAAGGKTGFMYGRFRATGKLDNGRQIVVYGQTGDEAEDMIRSLLTLSDANLIKKPTISEDRTEDVSGTYLKQPVKVYPAFFTIENQYQIAGALNSGIPINGKRYQRKEERIDLWTEVEPFNYDAIIQELLKKPGAEDLID
jgi:hypothetical protein